MFFEVVPRCHSTAGRSVCFPCFQPLHLSQLSEMSPVHQVDHLLPSVVFSLISAFSEIAGHEIVSYGGVPLDQTRLQFSSPELPNFLHKRLSLRAIFKDMPLVKIPQVGGRTRCKLSPSPA